jgi:hypothetical protein
VPRKEVGVRAMCEQSLVSNGKWNWLVIDSFIDRPGSHELYIIELYKPSFVSQFPTSSVQFREGRRKGSDRLLLAS